jgi:hypothetical protein
LIDFRLDLSRINHRAGRLEEPNRTELRSVGGIAAKVAMGSAAYSARFARTGSFSGKESGLTPWACGVRGRWHFPTSSKPFSVEVVVYERVSPSGRHPKLRVEISPLALTGRIEKSYVSTEPKPLELKRSQTLNREWGQLPEARRKRLRYRMSFIIA